MTTKTKPAAELPSPFKTVLPASIHTGKDRLVLRLDFYGEAIVLQTFDKADGSFKLVSAHDIARALAAELPFASGILPENTLWWSNSSAGPITALWTEPGVRRLALQAEAMKPPERYDVPLPGLIFLCRPGHPPNVYAATKRPAGPKERVFKAPLANIYNDGRSCPGSHQYPANVGEIPDNFFRSFFSEAADVRGRSKKYPERSITQIWRDLDGKQEYPLSDLVHHGTVADLMMTKV